MLGCHQTGVICLKSMMRDGQLMFPELSAKLINEYRVWRFPMKNPHASTWESHETVASA